MRPSHGLSFVAGCICILAFQDRDAALVWFAIGMVGMALWSMGWENGR